MGNCNCFTPIQKVSKTKEADVMVDDLPDKNYTHKEKVFESGDSNNLIRSISKIKVNPIKENKTLQKKNFSPNPNENKSKIKILKIK